VEVAIGPEQHLSGYAHVHAASSVDGAVVEEDVHRVIDAHLRECQIAGDGPRDCHSPDPNDRPISGHRGLFVGSPRRPGPRSRIYMYW